MDLADRLQLIVFYIVTGILALALFGALYEGQFFNAFLAFFALILSYTPAMIDRNFKISMPIEFDLSFLLFLFGSLYLGTAQGLYKDFWWWDIFLHTFSGILLGFIGFLIVYILTSEEKIVLSPVFVGLFSFVFAVALGVLWEIFEFLIDYFVGSNLQASGLVDTMSDLMVDSLGALGIAIIGYFYVKKVKVPLFDRLITKFIQKNPRLFRKWEHMR